MNRAVRETERMNNLHLYMLVIMTATAMVEAGACYFYGWEVWMLAGCVAALAFCWVIHVRGLFSVEQRRIIFALVIWLLVIYHGVQPTSLFEMTQLVVVEMLLFSQTDEKSYVHGSLGVYIFCFLYQMNLAVFTDRTDVVFDLLSLSVSKSNTSPLSKSA